MTLLCDYRVTINDSYPPEHHRRTDGDPNTPSSKDPVPSAYHRKGKCRKDIDLTKCMCDKGEPLCLPPGNGEESTWSNLFVNEFDLTVEQFILEPSMDVGDNSTSLRLLLNMVPAGRAQH